MKKILTLIVLLIFLLTWVFAVNAQSIDDQINKLKKDIDILKRELESKEADFNLLSRQLNEIKNRLTNLEAEIIKKQQEVTAGEKVLDYQRTLLFERTRVYYKNINKNTQSLINLFLGRNFSQSLENFFYQKTIVDEDRRTIIKIVLYIKDLEEKKRSLEQEKAQLTNLKAQVSQQSQVLSLQISQTREKIAKLTAQQQQLIAQKLASLNISRSASSVGRCDSDLINGRDPGFFPKFAFFTYGVPNRVGMNQWGAYGRARSGQNEEEILRSYYNFDSFSNFDTNTIIRVEGLGDYSLEEYVKRIYEVPDSWGDDGYAALKAQAIAARSYALAYTNNGQNTICATENCQVARPEPKGGNWERAVNDTSGKIMIKNGVPIKAWYSSTHGGYVFSSADIGWAATDWTKRAIDTNAPVNNFSDLKNNAYDRDSPWFYCDWGWRNEYNKTAWLKPEEVADIVNVILLVKRRPETGCFVYQTDKPPPAPDPNKGCTKTDNWSAEKVKQELGQGMFNYISDASVEADFGYGKTNSISFSGDGGSITLDGAEFKNWFNLRAPANVQIVGPLFNIEKR